MYVILLNSSRAAVRFQSTIKNKKIKKIKKKSCHQSSVAVSGHTQFRMIEASGRCTFLSQALSSSGLTVPDPLVLTVFEQVGNGKLRLGTMNKASSLQNKQSINLLYSTTPGTFSSRRTCCGRRVQTEWLLTHTQHNTTQHNTTQHNTTQHNTTQHNTTQHNTEQSRGRKDAPLRHDTRAHKELYRAHKDKDQRQ